MAHLEGVEGVCVYSWYSVEYNVLQRPPYEDVTIEKYDISHPNYSGFYISTGTPRGQQADYRKCLTDGRCLHVKEYKSKYDVHWDRFDPSENPIAHLVVDAPEWVILFGIITVGVFAFLLES